MNVVCVLILGLSILDLIKSLTFWFRENRSFLSIWRIKFLWSIFSILFLFGTLALWCFCVVSIFDNFNFRSFAVKFANEFFNCLFLFFSLVFTHGAIEVHFYVVVSGCHSSHWSVDLFHLNSCSSTILLNFLKHLFESLNFFFVLFQKRVFWILVNHWLVFNSFCSSGISECRKSFFVVVICRRAGGNHDSLCVSSKRILKQTCEFRISIWDMLRFSINQRRNNIT